jgi:putative copper export protein/methionine-rich copper-binding protein CopC
MKPPRSPTPPAIQRFLRRGLATRLIAALLFLMVVPGLAEAHQRLLRSDPPEDSTLDSVPRQLRLVFAEPVQLAFTRLELVGPDGAAVPLRDVGTEPDASNVLVAFVTGVNQPGSYLVRWSTASQDGHPVRGEFGFSLTSDAEGLAPLEIATPPQIDGVDPHPETIPTEAPPRIGGREPFGVESAEYVVIRWMQYISLLMVLGASSFSLLVLPRMREPYGSKSTLVDTGRAGAAGIGLAFVTVLVLVAGARLYAQALALYGSESAMDPEMVTTLLTRTTWGFGWILQVTAAIVAGFGFWLARRGSLNGWLVAAIAGLVLAITPALSGHAAAMTGALGTVAITADTLHVVGAAGWLGSLALLLAAGLPAATRLEHGRRGAAVAAMVGAFSPIALLFAGLLVLTGVLAIILHSGSVAALLASEYGRILFVKLGIFLLVFATGAYNYLRVRPALGEDAGTARLRRSAASELGMGVLVLLVTAMLVATARPYEAVPEAAEPHRGHSYVD